MNGARGGMPYTCIIESITEIEVKIEVKSEDGNTATEQAGGSPSAPIEVSTVVLVVALKMRNGSR